MRPSRNAARLLFLALPVAACAPGTPQNAGVAIDTTTSGRIVVSNMAGAGWADGEAWTLREVLRLGTLAGSEDDPGHDPEHFGSIASVAMDAQGRILVLDDQAQEIRVFDRSGGLSHTIGRPGQGPGEFEFARSMALSPGDTLVVRDDGTMRYSVFDPEGDLLATHRRDIVGTNGGAIPAWVEGRYVDWAPHSPEGRYGAAFSLLPIAWSRDFVRPDSLSPIEHRWRMLPNDRPMVYVTGVPLGALTAEGNVWLANSGTYEVHLRAPGGDTLRTTRLAVEARPVGPAEVAELEDRFGRLPEYLGMILEALPETQPPLELIASDPSGRLWTLPNTETRPSGTALDVFGPDGVFLGSVEIPGGDRLAARDGELLRVYHDHILVVRRDELDVPYVVLYEIER